MFRFLLLLSIFVSSVYAAPAQIDEFTASMQKQEGYFDFYYDENSGNVFLEIDVFNQPFLFQSSMPQGVGSNDIGLDRGQLGDTRLVQFERFGSKVLLKQLNTEYRASSANPAERASIDEAFADSVIAGLPVKATSDNRVLVDYTAFLLSDIHGIGNRLQRTKQGSYKANASLSGVYLPRTKAFPDNTEMEALVTFSGTKPGEYVRQVTPEPEKISVHLHHSLVRLPDANYQPRQYHPYSGFWKYTHQDYSVPIDESMEVAYIPRHRLEKKYPGAQMSEAVEPIVYYLDPGIPEPVKSALYDGALWWNLAFEKIGYKDAFQVKTLPENADPMDVRYNIIQWVHRATRGWSYGASVVDPRTGEIIKGHVTLGSLRVRQDYLIALGLTSPFKNGNRRSDAQKQMALARIRQLSAHEVGHTLGIAHNFAASANGRASVMDYPHPLISIKNNKVVLDNAYAVGMGAWDDHTIAYGYQDFPDGTNVSQALANIVNSARNQGLAYQSDADARPGHAANPQGHLWDNGDDPITEFIRVSDVRRLALDNFGLDTLKDGQSLASLHETLVPIYYFHRYQLQAVSKVLGGVAYTYELKGDNSQPLGVSPAAREKQQAALEAMLTSLSVDYLTMPDALLDLITPKPMGERTTRESIKGRTGLTFDPVSAAEAAAGFTTKLMLTPERLNRLSQQHAQNGSALGVSDVVDALIKQTIQGKYTPSDAPVYERVAFVTLNQLMNTMASDSLAPEVAAELMANVMELHKWAKKQKRSAMAKAMGKQLEWYLQTGEWKGGFDIKPMPPGSPI